MKSPKTPSPTARLLAVAIAGLGLASVAQAQAILAGRTFSQVASSPTTAQFVTTSGAGTINSAGQTGPGFFYGSGNIATFESTPGYSTVQTFPTGLNNFSTAKALNFLDTAPDVYFSSNVGTNTSVVTSGTYLTSAGNGLRLQVAASTAFTLTISLGTLDADGSNFIFNANRGASALGFALSGTFANLVGTTATVSFYSSNNTLLSSQALNGTVEGDPGQTSVSGVQNRWAFTGWRNTSGIVANDIAYATIGFTTGTSSAIIALDDFGYSTTAISAVPEPSSAAALAGLGAIGLALGGRRRRR